jgi:hypothetical protein
MAKAANNKELATGFQQHLEQQRACSMLATHSDKPQANKQTNHPRPNVGVMEGIVAEGI